jgi:hypothetical protein
MCGPCLFCFSKAVVQIGDMKPKETSPVKVSRKGHCQITGAPVTVDVDGATAERHDTQGNYRLQCHCNQWNEAY